MNKVLLYYVLFLLSLSVCGQNLQDGQKLWSEDDKLELSDFKLRINDVNNEALYSQFGISYQIGGFSFLSKNLNQKIVNSFLGNASWINEEAIHNEEQQLVFQQLQFDLCEVFTRKFRKEALIQKKKILKGYDYLTALNNKIMADFSKERAKLIKETIAGSDQKKVEEWELLVKNQLDSLHEFRFENKKKIKIKTSR